jgi:hypothetical protein
MLVRMKCTPAWYEAGKWGWLKSYDPEAHDGRGTVEFTDDASEAMTFPDVQTAHACYYQIPKAKPVRDDGPPNRPLTAYSIEITDARN